MPNSKTCLGAVGHVAVEEDDSTSWHNSWFAWTLQYCILHLEPGHLGFIDFKEENRQRSTVSVGRKWGNPILRGM